MEHPINNQGQRYIAPRTQTEKKLTDIWCAVLSLNRIGIYDNFVDLGGHSILAVQCLNRVRDSFGLDLPPTVLFTETANVREVAELIDNLATQNSNSMPPGKE
jgi:acyl carrier protein